MNLNADDTNSNCTEDYPIIDVPVEGQDTYPEAQSSSQDDDKHDYEYDNSDNVIPGLYPTYPAYPSYPSYPPQPSVQPVPGQTVPALNVTQTDPGQFTSYHPQLVHGHEHGYLYLPHCYKVNNVCTSVNVK